MCREYNNYFGLENAFPKYPLLSLIIPVVMYGAEAWEIDDFTVIERLHLKLCKYILSLNKCTYKKMLYDETGEIPLSLDVLHVKCGLITYQTKKLSSFIFKFIIYFTHK